MLILITSFVEYVESKHNVGYQNFNAQKVDSKNSIIIFFHLTLTQQFDDIMYSTVHVSCAVLTFWKCRYYVASRFLSS